MALNPIRPRLRNISNGVAKVQLIIPAGDEIEVSAEVAEQLERQRAPFSDATAPEQVDAPADGDAPKARKPRARKATA